jgi:hypothetical protein
MKCEEALRWPLCPQPAFDRSKRYKWVLSGPAPAALRSQIECNGTSIQGCGQQMQAIAKVRLQAGASVR